MQSPALTLAGRDGLTHQLARIMLGSGSIHPRQRGDGPGRSKLGKLRVFGECMLTVAMIALSLAIGYGVMGSVASQAMFASLN